MNIDPLTVTWATKFFIQTLKDFGHPRPSKWLPQNYLLPPNFGLVVKRPTPRKEGEDLIVDVIRGKIRRFAYYLERDVPISELSLEDLKGDILKLAEQVDREAKRCRARVFLEQSEAILKSLRDPYAGLQGNYPASTVAVKIWGISAGAWRKVK